MAWHVCLVGAGGERKACDWILSQRQQKPVFQGRFIFCVRSANRHPEIISHNALLRQQETLESPDDCGGAYDGEGERERRRERRRARPVQASLWLFWTPSEVIGVLSAPPSVATLQKASAQETAWLLTRTRSCKTPPDQPKDKTTGADVHVLLTPSCRRLI